MVITGKQNNFKFDEIRTVYLDVLPTELLLMDIAYLCANDRALPVRHLSSLKESCRYVRHYFKIVALRGARSHFDTMFLLNRRFYCPDDSNKYDQLKV